jgi:hypothetical protein
VRYPPGPSEASISALSSRDGEAGVVWPRKQRLDDTHGRKGYRALTLASGTSLSRPYFLTFKYSVLLEIRSSLATRVRLP